MVPPGIPDFLSRARHVRAGKILVDGRAWSGFGAIERVEFSPDGDETWNYGGYGVNAIQRVPVVVS